jgi:ATP-dependent Clp protease, protease subunit
MSKPFDPSLSAEDRVESRLLQSHIHFLNGDIDENNIRKAIQWIAYENLSNETKTLKLYVNSQGGDLYQAFALIDVMRVSKHPISTIGLGSVMSAAFLIFVSGTAGHRLIAPNTGIMCHQYSDTTEGKHHDLKATMIEGENCNNRMLSVLEAACELDAKTIKRKLLNPTDVYLTADQLIELGLADEILA